MAIKIYQKNIDVAKKILFAERAHRSTGGEPNKHHDIARRKRSVEEVDFLVKLIEELWWENMRLRGQKSLF